MRLKIKKITWQEIKNHKNAPAQTSPNNKLITFGIKEKRESRSAGCPEPLSFFVKTSP